MKKDHPKPVPPQWARKLLKWYCSYHLLEEIQGDLDEEFEHQVKQKGLRKARTDYALNVLGFIKPFAIKGKQNIQPNTTLNMNIYRHYLVVAFRNLVRQKAFSFLNILGLALGISSCLVIYLWTENEKSIDNFHENGQSLYSVYHSLTSGGEVSGGYKTPNYIIAGRPKEERLSFSDVLKENVPGIQYATMYTTGYELPWGHPVTFQVEEKQHKLEGSMASPDFFKMFNYKFIAGDRETALEAHSIAISRKMASMFFDAPEDAIGKSIRYENRLDLNITAVFEDVTKESSLKFDYVISWEAMKTGQVEISTADWHTFVQIDNNTDVAETESRLNQLIDKPLLIETLKNFMQITDISIGLKKFGDMHLHSAFINGRPSGGRIEYVRIFQGVGLFIIVIACINFMNLATSRSLKRAKEVGVRKTIGSSRSSLIVQFLGESVLLSFMALILSLALCYALLLGFNQITGTHLTLPLSTPSFWLYTFGFTLLVGFFSGSYPAVYLSGMDPVNVLKGRARFGKNVVITRQGLVVLQFVISLALIIASTVVSLQTDYMQNTHLGYDRENLLYIRIEGELNPKYSVFKEQATSMPGIALVDRSSEAPHDMKFILKQPFNWEGNPNEINSTVGFYPTSVGFDFLNLMDLEIVKGRNFSKDIASDTAAFMVNEEALKQMEMKDPIGKWVSAWDKKGPIIGILKDYHAKSLHDPIVPLIVDVKEDLSFGNIVVRTQPGKLKEALVSLEKVCKEINPDFPFAYTFLDHEFEKLYKSELMTTRLSNIFAILAIIISCLGLLGLIMFSVEQRQKELSLRKVLGANLQNLVGLLSKDFLVMILISFTIAAPVAGYFMYDWLQNFTYRIGLSWWIFLLAGASVLLITLIIVLMQSIRTLNVNPLKHLQSE